MNQELNPSFLIKEKKPGKKSIFYLIIIAAVVVVLIGVVFYLNGKKSSLVSKCEDMECVKTLALKKNFNPEDCEQAPQEFRDDCYFNYEVENTEAEKANPGEYCGRMSDDVPQSECFYKTKGTLVTNTGTNGVMESAILNLDASSCDKISVPELNEICLNGARLVQEAMENKDPSLCTSDESVHVYNYLRWLCQQVSSAKIKELEN